MQNENFRELKIMKFFGLKTFNTKLILSNENNDNESIA